jgi:hypothetical protein
MGPITPDPDKSLKEIINSTASAELPTMAELMINGFDTGWPWSSMTIWNAPWRGEIFA